ncbi:DDB1- and CUL4-associated factor 5 isoform X1 [Sarcophilus harrisii]|uniref:DDB1- and CUL4-associated factor 5 n=2 Tax=Sarcophilus harrisii TaxID=9305 RepID=A0A7N4NJ13_SARHA|nr:DDB1- and CUL4-associated factor 5 isoform X1 [Sarcophilus harrisii]
MVFHFARTHVPVPQETAPLTEADGTLSSCNPKRRAPRIAKELRRKRFTTQKGLSREEWSASPETLGSSPHWMALGKSGQLSLGFRRRRRRGQEPWGRSMKKRAGPVGSSMRSVVGFLSQRGLQGDPLLTQDFQRRRLRGCRNLYKKDLLGHFGCVNAIEFSNNGGQWLVSGGDDRRVLLWHMEQAIHSRVKPVQLKGEHHSNIFCLAFNSGNTKVFSGGNDEQVILHDVESSETLDVFAHEDAVYGLSVSPVNDNVFASSSDDGRVLIWDIRESPHGEPFCLANYPSAFHSVMFNPVEPRLLATANSKEGVGLWDIRKPQSSLLRYGGNLSLQSAMSVRFNSNGTQLLALRRRLPPVLYDIHSRLPVFQFDNQGYFNSCTMKSCCFAGDRDQYILSGSDDFNLYMWRIPPDPEAGGIGRVVNGAFMVLKGHRSIVNQVRFNPHTYMICSSGVEKIIKIWSPYKQPGCTGDLDGRIEDDSRCLYTHEEYISLVLNSGSGLSHDYANQSVQEDPRMMAFFDSLVRREIEGWSSDSDSDLSESTILQLHAGVSERSGYSDSESSASLHHSPPPVANEPADTGFHLGPLGAAAIASPPPSSCEDVASRQQRLSALRRYQDKRLLALSNESDSDENACEAELDTDLFPRPRSPSPEENESSSSSSSSSTEDEEELNERRTSTRQRNAMRRRQKPPRDDRPGAPAKHTGTYIGEDNYDYPQIKVDDLSSSPASSPERSTSNVETHPGRASPASDMESVERKIYKAYKWLHYSYISYSTSKDEETSLGVGGEADEGKPGTSEKSHIAPSSSRSGLSAASPHGSQELPIEGQGREALKEGSPTTSPSHGPGCDHDSHAGAEEQEGTSQSTSNPSSLEHTFETKKLNGKSIGKALSERSEEQPLSTAPKGSCLALGSGPTSCPRTQSDDSEERNLETVCPNHNNGHFHPRPLHLHNNGQNFGESEAITHSSPGHSDADNDNVLLPGALLHKDCHLSEMDCEDHSTGTKEDLTEPHLPDIRGSHGRSGLKRHRGELEDTDSENSCSEKKLKT